MEELSVCSRTRGASESAPLVFFDRNAWGLARPRRAKAKPEPDVFKDCAFLLRAGEHRGSQLRTDYDIQPANPPSAAWFTYIFRGDWWLATHCHLPFGILVHVSVKRSLASRGLPDGSVPLPRKFPIAIAVSPKTITFRSM